jgi:hypothetical protein
VTIGGTGSPNSEGEEGTAPAQTPVGAPGTGAGGTSTTGPDTVLVVAGVACLLVAALLAGYFTRRRRAGVARRDGPGNGPS